MHIHGISTGILSKYLCTAAPKIDPLQWRQKSFHHNEMPLGRSPPLQFKVSLALKKAHIWAT